MFSVPIDCCNNVTIRTARLTSLNQLYFLNGSRVSNRPLYIGSDETHGIWYDGVESWMVGDLADLNE